VESIPTTPYDLDPYAREREYYSPPRLRALIAGYPQLLDHRAGTLDRVKASRTSWNPQETQWAIRGDIARALTHLALVNRAFAALVVATLAAGVPPARAGAPYGLRATQVDDLVNQALDWLAADLGFTGGSYAA
jgi:hypothetical protein